MVNAFSYTVANSDYYTTKAKAEGTLTITPATLTIVTESDSKEYDGTALTADGSIDGFVFHFTFIWSRFGAEFSVGFGFYLGCFLKRLPQVAKILYIKKTLHLY